MSESEQEVDWTALQKEAADLKVLKRGMTMPEVQAAVEEARTRQDPRNKELDEREGGRIPLGGFRQNLKLPAKLNSQLTDKGYHPRFFVEDNLNRARDAGFTPVKVDEEGNLSEDGQWYQVAKGRTKEGGSSVNYLMKQLVTHRDEDKAAKRHSLDELDQALRRGDPTGQESSNPAIYTPDGENREINKREFRR